MQIGISIIKKKNTENKKAKIYSSVCCAIKVNVFHVLFQIYPLTKPYHAQHFKVTNDT